MRKVEDDLNVLKREYENMKIPDRTREVMLRAMDRAVEDKRKAAFKKKIKTIGLWVVAVLAVLCILPNTNKKIAYAMEQLPLVGKIFEVVTIREYSFEDRHNHAKVKVPKIITQEDHPAVSDVNKEVEEYTNKLLAQFENNMLVEGYQNLDVFYEVVTNNETWFALDIAAVETQASGYEFHRFYNIDKSTGQQVQLKDLFKEGSDYIGIISEEIINQMKTKMEQETGVVYWIDNEEYPENNFKEIKENQNFYLDEDKNLIVVFDEYEIAPGYMGVQRFLIPQKLLKNILK